MTRIDARGLRCPWPALRAGRALREGAEAIEVAADDPAAERELRALAASTGCAFRSVGAGVYRLERAAA
ncbi:sulfurtransferase TusA family protein [Sphingomonas sp.]